MRPLRYLIGIDQPDLDPNYVTEVSYDSTSGDIGYCNLFDEKNTGRYGPYRTDSDTARNYSEGEINPTGPGWVKNLSRQFKRRSSQGFKFIELDNPDAYTIHDICGAIDLAAKYGLRVIAKNPGLLSTADDQVQFVAKCEGIIVEQDAGTPEDMDRIRCDRPIPIWFVSFGSGLHWIRSLDVTKYDNMWKSYSRQGEYGSSEEI